MIVKEPPLIAESLIKASKRSGDFKWMNEWLPKNGARGKENDEATSLLQQHNLSMIQRPAINLPFFRRKSVRQGYAKCFKPSTRPRAGTFRLWFLRSYMLACCPYDLELPWKCHLGISSSFLESDLYCQFLPCDWGLVLLWMVFNMNS